MPCQLLRWHLPRWPLLLVLLCLASTARAAPLSTVLGSLRAPGGCVTGLTWDGQHLWAADHKTDTLYQIDRATGRILRRLPSPGYRPLGLTWDGTHLWNVDPRAGKLYRVDVGRGLTVQTVDTPIAEPTALAWDGKHLWLASTRGGKLLRLDTGDGTTIAGHPSRTSRRAASPR